MQEISYILGWGSPFIALVGYFTSDEPLTLIIGLIMYLMELGIEWKRLNAGAKFVDGLIFVVGSIVSVFLGKAFYIGGIIALEVYSLVVSVISLPETISLAKNYIQINKELSKAKCELPTELQKYVKIGGWLELFCITLIFGTISAFATVVTTVIERNAYATMAYAINFSFACVGLLINIIFICMIVTRNVTFIQFNTAMVVLSVLVNLLIVEDFTSLVTTNAIQIIWAVYFHMSKRTAVYFDYKLSRFLPAEEQTSSANSEQGIESSAAERNAHLQKMIRSAQDAKYGNGNNEEAIPICLSSIVNYMVSPQKAHKNLSEEKFQQFLSIYQNYDADIYETPMTVEDYNKVSAHIVEKFNAIVPWDKIGAIAISGISEQENCSNLLTAHDQDDDKKTNASTENSSSQTTMRRVLFCRKCGNKLPPDCNFCPKCGTRIEMVKEV